MPWILFLKPHTECAQFSEDNNRYYTWSGLCTESNCAGMYSVQDRVIVDNMNEFQHLLSRRLHPLMQDSRVKRRRKHVCQLKAFKLQSVEPTTTARVASQPGPEKSVCSLSLCHPHASLGSDWALKVVRHVGRPVIFTKFRIACCSCFAHCTCFAHCCHDLFIVRSASNLTTVPWFHSVCASVSMFTINTGNCPFLLLLLLLLLFLLLVSPSLQSRRQFHHRLFAFIL